MDDILHDADIKDFDRRDGRTRITRVFRAPDKSYDLLVYMKIQANVLTCAQVRKTVGIGREQFQCPTAFDVECALQSIMYHPSHTCRFPDRYQFTDIYRDFQLFTVPQEQIEAYLETQRDSLGPIEIPDELRPTGDAKKMMSVHDDPNTSRTKPNVAQTATGHHADVDSFLSEIDELIGEQRSDRSDTLSVTVANEGFRREVFEGDVAASMRETEALLEDFGR